MMQFKRTKTRNTKRSKQLWLMKQWRTQDFFSGGGKSTNSVVDRENGDLGGGSPLVSGSAQFANEWNPYSY
jgi:hypothetical protein